MNKEFALCVYEMNLFFVFFFNSAGMYIMYNTYITQRLNSLIKCEQKPLNNSISLIKIYTPCIAQIILISLHNK